MKKYFSFLAAAVLMLGFAACSDVPAPYSIFDDEYEGGGDSPSGGIVTELPYAEAFSSSLGKFVSINTSGSGDWIIDFSTAKAAGYNNSTKVTTPGTYYLVSPEIQLPEEACHIMFEYILRYVASNDDQQLLISDNWNEEAPTEGWTLVNNVFTEGRDWNTFTQADINVPEQFQGKTVRIALRYNCGESGSTWEVKNLVVDKGSGQDGQIDGQGGTDPQPQTDAILSAPFSTALTSNLGDFLTWDEQGNGYNWTYNSTYKCAYMTSYDSPSKTNHPANAWLISPAFDLTGVTAAYVTFDYKLAYASGNNDEYRILIGKGFPGEGASPGRISWTQLPVTWTMLSSFSGAAWSNTGKLAIPAEYLGQSDIRVAIQYISTEKAATWEIQNLIVAAGEADDPTQGGGDDPTQGGDEPIDVTGAVTVTAEGLGLENNTELTSYNLNEGIALNFAKNEGANPPKYYAVDKSARLYAQNSLTITSLNGQNIKAIVINCSPTYNGTNYRGNEQMTTTSGTISKNAAAETITINGINAPELKITNAFTQNSAGVQLRIVSMQVIFDDGTSAVRRWRR